jgi:hypothetical protein
MNEMNKGQTLETAAELRATAWYRPLARLDLVYIGLLAILPWLLYGIPTLLGHPALAGDNLIQNYPLRVLSGQILRTGHLPLLNLYANSGTPLLGAMNAGSLYPLTLLFAFCPGPLAWLINLFAVYFVAGLGAYALARWLRFGSTSAFVASLFYAYSGAMMGQMVHLGVVQGYSFLPWLVLVMFAWQRDLADCLGSTWRSLFKASARWMVALSGIWGLTFLTGEPRAIAEVELLFLILLGRVLVLRPSWALPTFKHRIALLVASAVATGWGVAIGLVQMLPGWDFIGISQRASLNYWFFGSGSLVIRWTGLLWFPTLLGGNGSWGQPGYYANYNLPEVTSYVGLLALVAAAVFFSRLKWRARGDATHELNFFALLAVIGLVATWGSFTPLGHVLRLIPLFGSTRLQSRNIVLVDLALCVFLAWLLDEVREGRWNVSKHAARTKFAVLFITGLVVGTVSLLWVGGARFSTWLGAVPRSAHLVERQWPIFITFGLLVSLFAVLLLRKEVPKRFRWLVSLAIIDLALFLALGQTSVYLTTGTVANHPISAEPSRSAILKLIGPVNGRTAILDRFGSNETEVEQIGLANLNVFTGIPSVQGYGSLINEHYSLVTGTHPRASFDVCAFKRGVFEQLDLSTVIVNTAALVDHNTPRHHPEPVCSRSVGPTALRYWGQALRVTKVVLSTTGSQASHFQAQLIDTHSRPVGRAINGRRSGSAINFDFSQQGMRSYGVRITSTNSFAVADAKVFSSSGVSFDLVTPFQDAITSLSDQWRLAGTVGGLSIFHFRGTSVSTRLIEDGGVGGSRLESSRSVAWGDEFDVVYAAKPVTLTRSMAYLPGWRVTALNLTNHKTEALPVSRHGLILSTRVPKGQWQVHWHYHAPYIELGLASTALATFLWLVAATFLLTRVSARRRTKVGS